MSGKVDAVVGTPPECIEVIRHGCKYLIDFAEYGLNYALGGIAGAARLRRTKSRDHAKVCQSLRRRHAPYRSDREFTVDVQAE